MEEANVIFEMWLSLANLYAGGGPGKAARGDQAGPGEAGEEEGEPPNAAATAGQSMKLARFVKCQRVGYQLCCL